ncbi:MAG: hypothetical protein ACI4A3_11545 [Lachnospiraceae bacterium]
MEQSKVLMQMKKLKLSVMLCMVLFGLWFMSGEVFAATIRQTKTATKANPVDYIDYSSRADGKYDMTVGVYLDSTPFPRSVLSGANGYKVTVYTDDAGVIFEKKDSYNDDSLDYRSIKVSSTAPIQPGTKFSVLFVLYTDTECTEVVSGYSFIEEEFTAPAAYNISTDKNAPVSISVGESVQEIKGPANVQGNYVYYTFTLQDAATLTGSISGIGTYYLYNELGDQKYTDRCSSETAIEWELPAGTYLLKGSPLSTSEYSLKLKSTPFNWGTVSIDWGGTQFPASSGKSIPYTVTLTGGDSSVEIYSVLYSSGGGEQTSKEQTVVKGNILLKEAGDHTLTVYLTANYKNFGNKEVKFSYSCKPAPPSCELTVANNAATLNVYTKDSYVDVYKDGKWQTYKASDYNYCLKLKSLKANTQYKYRAYVTENGYTSDYNQETFYTAHKAKPSIKSIKVSNVKTVKYPREWHSGYYDGGGNWHAGYYTPAYTMIHYKLTVTLKKNPPKGASTYVVINDQFVKAKGKKYTVTGKYKGKIGQKIKVTVRFGRNKGYGGLGKYVSKKVTVK